MNDYVEVPDAASLDSTGDLSIEFWMEVQGIGDTVQSLISKRYNADATSPFQVLLDNRSGLGYQMAIRFILGGGSRSYILDANNAVGLGQWAHVVATVSGTTVRIYINGVERATGTFPGTRQANNIPVRIGVYPIGELGSLGYYFNGLLDEVKIYREVITPPPPPLALSDAALPDGMVGEGYNHVMSAIGGTPSYTWLAEGLPSSLSINASTGAITGTPTVGEVGDHSVSITVQDGASGEDTKSYTLTITPEPSTLVGEWRFDEGSGATATDASGMGNHGTIYGASYAGGYSGTALLFDGVNDYVEVPDAASLDSTGDLSIEFWMEVQGIGDTVQSLISKRYNADATSPFQVLLDNRSGLGYQMAIRFILGGGSRSYILDANNAVGLGQWAHVVATVSGTTVRIYINGVERATGTFPGTRQANNIPVRIGVYPIGELGSLGYYFNGLLDEVKIYREVITPPPPTLPSGRAVSLITLVMDKVIAKPNPVRGDRVTFEAAEVSGKAISGITRPMRLEIYDLAGREVFATDWLDTNTFEWFLQNDKGDILANGVYIYVVYLVDEDGGVKANSKGKLFVLR